MEFKERNCIHGVTVENGETCHECNLDDMSKQYEIEKKELKSEVDRLSASLAAAQESLRKIYEMPFSSGCGDEQRIAQEALSDPTGHLAFEKWKALQNTKQEYDKAMNVCLDKFSNQKFGSVADCLNGIFEKWKKMEAVVTEALKWREKKPLRDRGFSYEIEFQYQERDLEKALEALDAKGGVK